MSDVSFMRLALRLARRGYGSTSPNPLVGAVLVKAGRVVGRGWHRCAGGPHAEIEAIQDAQKHGYSPRGSTLYVTLEPCSTHGRTPPCTDAILDAGIRRVVIGTTDPNPDHAGRGGELLRRAGIKVLEFQGGDSPTAHRAAQARLERDCTALNAVFNHWIVRRTPFVTVKAAMTLDGKIATAGGQSKWVTGEKARAQGMKLRLGSDAVLVGVNTVLADDPSLTVRGEVRTPRIKPLRRIILDSLGRTPLTAKVVSDGFAACTTVVVSRRAPKARIAALAKKVNVIMAPLRKSERGARPQVDPGWLLKKLGAENITSLLVEGGGEVNASFLLGGFAQSVAFFYAPKILGGSASRKGVAGEGATNPGGSLRLANLRWRRLGDDLMLSARVVRP